MNWYRITNKSMTFDAFSTVSFDRHKPLCFPASPPIGLGATDKPWVIAGNAMSLLAGQRTISVFVLPSYPRRMLKDYSATFAGKLSPLNKSFALVFSRLKGIGRALSEAKFIAYKMLVCSHGGKATSLSAASQGNTMGSGTTGAACMNTGRKFIGIEMDDGCFHIAAGRITAATPALENPPLYP